MVAEKIAVIGAGVGGLAVALELGREHEVTLIERDPAPPDIPPESAFEEWQRPGVPQFRHAHILLSRLRTAIRDRHPELLDELLKAGLYLSTLDEVLPAGVEVPASPTPDDDDLLHLWGRRATFEFVLRRYVSRFPNVRFVTETRVVGLVTEDLGGEIQVRGLSLSRHGETETLPATIVVDASGKRSKCGEWLEALGVAVSTKREESGFVYSCRHYRLKDPSAAPPRRDGGGSLDYLGYSLFYQEHGTYSLTFGCPETEEELTDAIRTPEGFEALAQQFPVLKRWVDASEPTTKVLGAGRFENRWTVYGAAGGKKLTGFFAVGDSRFETNPMYGRGCSAAFVQARVLAESLALPTAEARAEHYERESRRLLHPYYDISVSTDRVFHLRAKLRRGAAIAGPDKLVSYLYDKAWLPATHTSLFVAREFLRAVQMREISALWIRLVVAMRVGFALLLTWLGQRVPHIAAPPPRAEFLSKVARTRRQLEQVHHEPG